MAKEISLIQDEDVEYKIRQGIAYWIPIFQEEIDVENSTPQTTVWKPIDISSYTFFAQLRKDTAASGGTVLHTFSLTPPPDGTAKGSYYEIDVAAAKTTYFFSDELTRSLKANETYYFEEKTIDSDGNAIDSIVMKFKIAPEYARAQQ